jgi:hypothetical protein
MEQVIAQIKQALEQGADPRQIIGQLLQQYQPEQVMQIFQAMGAPAEEVQTMIQEVMQGGQQQAQQPQQGGQDQQIQQLIMAFAQMSGQDPQAIMQQLQQVPPEQQQEAIQQMAMAVQQAQQGQMQQQPQAKKGMQMPDNAGWNALPENAKEAIIENMTKKMIDGGITKKDFRAIAKDMMKEYKDGGETTADSFDSSSPERFHSNLVGAVKNWVGKNLEVGRIKNTAKLMIDTFADLKEKKNLKKAVNGEEKIGAVTEKDLGDGNGDGDGNKDGNGDGEKKYTKEELQNLINEGEIRWDATKKEFVDVDPSKVNTPFSRNAKPGIFNPSKTPTIKAAGDSPLTEELKAFQNFDPETQKIQKTPFATNIFGKKITDPEKANKVIERKLRKGKNPYGGYNLQVVPIDNTDTTSNENSLDQYNLLAGMQQGGELNYNDKLIWDFKNHCYVTNPTLPKAEGGIDVGSKTKLNINWANLADRTVAGMNDINTFLELSRTYDKDKELASRQKYAQPIAGGDSGLFSAIQRGKPMLDEYGARIRPGTGSDPYALGLLVQDYNTYDTQNMGQFKEGGQVNGNPKEESDEDFVKRMQAQGVKIKLK